MVEFGGQDGRQTYQAPRPKRDRLKAGDEDDDPVIVDEQGETVNKDEFERRMKGEDMAESSKGGEASQSEAEAWVGESWRELLADGVDAVSLYEGDRLVYGPMSLHPQ